MEIKLYRKNANSIGTWRIWSEGSTIHIAHATVMGGQEVFHQEEVQTNLSGRTLDQQIKLRITSRVSRMMDKGYKTTLDGAKASNTNQLGLARPMLAHPIDRVSTVNYSGSVLQKKLDGHRCLITRQDGRVIAYSRQGKEIPTIGHVLSDVAHRIPEGVTIDGELYCHGQSLQTLASWIKREQPATRSLVFVAYDLMARDSYVDRHRELADMIKATSNVAVLGYTPYESDEHTSELFKRVRAQGFEGLMLRAHNFPYEDGKRSNGLLKIKHFEDDEFEVIGFEESKNGWAICQCRAKNGKTFGVSAPGTLDEKRHVWMNQGNFLGRKLTVEYAFLTSDGIPFHPNAIRWHVEI